MSGNIRRLYVGDNLPVLRGLESESVDLIYLDPPFNSKRIYEGNLDPEMGKQSFKDIWKMSDINKDDLWALRAFVAPQAYDLIMTLAASHGESWQAYLTFMAIRLDEMRRVLKPTGSIYLHCDWHMNAPLRLLMDILFGADNFQNEIVWSYRRWPAKQKRFQSMHDTLLFYATGDDRVWNQQYEPLSDSTIKRFKGKKILSTPKNSQSRRLPSRTENIDSPDAPMRDVWNIGIIAPVSKERTGWSTQKPLALLERIIKASSNKGDIVLDPFCGCATACIAAERLNRQWIGIDQHPAVGGIMEDRIRNDTKLAPEWDGVTIIDARKARNLPRRKGVREIDKTNVELKKEFYDTQGGKCKSGELCLMTPGGALPMSALDWDRIDPGKRGGYYTHDNVQLLCRTCNTAKGAKVWSRFIRERREQESRKIAENSDVPR